MIRYKHEGLVRVVVAEVARTISNRWRMSLDIDDLVQVGNIGAWHADKNYIPEHGTPFKAYMLLCIRWAIYNELHDMDYIPRWVRDKINNGDADSNDIAMSGNSIMNWESYFNNVVESDDPSYANYSFNELVNILIKCDGGPRPGILTAFVCGMSKAEIGVMHGITRMWAGKIVEERRDKFKKLLEER